MGREMGPRKRGKGDVTRRKRGEGWREGGKEKGVERGRERTEGGKRKRRKNRKRPGIKHPADKGLPALGSASSKQVHLLKSMPPPRSQ